MYSIVKLDKLFLDFLAMNLQSPGLNQTIKHYLLLIATAPSTWTIKYPFKLNVILSVVAHVFVKKSYLL